MKEPFNVTDNMREIKKALRQTFSSLRKNIPQSLRKTYSAQIGERLRSTSFWQKSVHIALYYSVGAEVDTIGIIKRGWQEQKIIYLPKSDPHRHQLHFYAITSFGQLSQGHYGIPEPCEGKEPLDVKQLDLVLVPGLAFDCWGYRLGYGGGYYDRFLSQLSPETVKIGLAYDSQLSEIPLPREPFDQPVDLIITERRLLLIRSAGNTSCGQ